MDNHGRWPLAHVRLKVLAIRGQAEASPTEVIKFTARFGTPVHSNWGEGGEEEG